MHSKTSYKTVLLKLSGEAFLGENGYGIDPEAVLIVAQQIQEIRKLNLRVGVVIGGGNIFRGSQAQKLGMSREKADQMGMLATLLNGMVLESTLRNLKCPSVLRSSFSCGSFITAANTTEALALLEEGNVVIFGGGTGHSYFTTDTAAALRACQIHADVLIKGTKVDGIFDKDPIKHPKAQSFKKISYTDVLQKRLNVMDATAIVLCQENKIPIHVVNIFKKGALISAICHQNVGSIVTGE